jgi:hypothetical protein
MERKPDPTEGDRDLSFYPVDISRREALSAVQLRAYNEVGYISPGDVLIAIVGVASPAHL